MSNLSKEKLKIVKKDTPIKNNVEKLETEVSLKLGALVRLRSGSPVMTIEKYDPECNLAECSWYDLEKGIFLSMDFRGSVLINHVGSVDQKIYDFSS